MPWFTNPISKIHHPTKRECLVAGRIEPNEYTLFDVIRDKQNISFKIAPITQFFRYACQILAEEDNFDFNDNHADIVHELFFN